MPEGHTLHRVARAWRPLVGRRVTTTSPPGRFADAQLLDGRVVEDVQADGKHLPVDFGEVDLHVHLGLAGSILEAAPGSTPARGVRLRVAVEPPGPTWDVVAPLAALLERNERELPRPARSRPAPGDDPEPAFTQIVASEQPIGGLLLDQRVIAGAGNVFRAEVLHRCGVHPQRPGSSLTSEDLRCLWTTLTHLMERATEEGRS